MGKKVLILASVASMIDQFNMPNIRLLKDMGYKVHVACNFEEGNTCSYPQIEKLKFTLKELNVEYYQIDFKRNVMKVLDNIKAYKQVTSLMKNNMYEFVHCHSPIGGVVGRIGGKITKTRVVYTAHGFHFYEGAPFKNWIVYYPIEKWLSRYTDCLVTINKEDYNRAKKSFNAKKVRYIPGVGLDVDKYSITKIDKKLKCKELGLPEDSFVILSIGELNKNKNHQTVIKALKKLNNSKIHYVICGQGQLEYYLKNLIEKLGLEKQVHLLGFRKDIPEILKMSDLFIFPSFREGLSVALMESMAAGLPVVCSDIRGNSDLIENGLGGYLVKPDDVDGFKIAINKLRKSEKLRKDFSDNNIKEIKNYSFDSITKEVERIY